MLTYQEFPSRRSQGIEAARELWQSNMFPVNTVEILMGSSNFYKIWKRKFISVLCKHHIWSRLWAVMVNLSLICNLDEENAHFYSRIKLVLTLDCDFSWVESLFKQPCFFHKKGRAKHQRVGKDPDKKGNKSSAAWSHTGGARIPALNTCIWLPVIPWFLGNSYLTGGLLW